VELALSQSPCQSKRRWLIQPTAACSEAARSDPSLFAAVMLAAVMLEAVRLDSGKFDPAPAPAETSAPVNLGKSAIYGTTFGHPVETRSAALIIPPIASRSGRSFPPSLTQARAGKLPTIFTNLRLKAQFGAASHPNNCHLGAAGTSRSAAPLPSWLTPCRSRLLFS
jgi:hypothetical protein